MHASSLDGMIDQSSYGENVLLKLMDFSDLSGTFVIRSPHPANICTDSRKRRVLPAPRSAAFAQDGSIPEEQKVAKGCPDWFTIEIAKSALEAKKNHTK